MSKIDLNKLSNVDFNSQYINKQGEVKQRGWLGRLIQTVASGRSRSNEIKALSNVIRTLQRTSRSHESLPLIDQVLSRLSSRLTELQGPNAPEKQVSSVARQSFNWGQPPEVVQKAEDDYRMALKTAERNLNQLRDAGHPLPGGNAVLDELVAIKKQHLAALQTRVPPEEEAKNTAALTTRLNVISSQAEFASNLFDGEQELKALVREGGDPRWAHESFQALQGIMTKYLRASAGATRIPEAEEAIRKLTEQVVKLRESINSQRDSLSSGSAQSRDSDLNKLDDLLAEFAMDELISDDQPISAQAEPTGEAPRPILPKELQATPEITHWEAVQFNLFIVASSDVVDSFQTRFDDLVNKYLNADGAVSQKEFLGDIAKLTEDAEKASGASATTPATAGTQSTDSPHSKWIEAGKTYISQLDQIKLEDSEQDEVDNLKQQFADLSRAVLSEPTAVETLEEIVMQLGEKVAELK